MTSYLQGKNRQVRRNRLAERAFEIFISHLPLPWLKDFAAGVGVVFIFGLFVLAGRVWLGQ